jgi:predicted Zn-dependent protease
MKSRDEIEALLEKALSNVRAQHAQAEYYFHHKLATRFGQNAITQNMGGAEEYLRLVVAYGKNHGSSITNKLDTASIDTLVEQAEEIAKSSPIDPEYMAPIESQTSAAVPQRYYEDVAQLTPRLGRKGNRKFAEAFCFR